MKSLTSLFSLIVMGLFLLSCAGDLDSKLEQIERHLDKGEYTEAETKAREILADEPGHVEAKFLLAGALIGRSVLSGGKSYLGLFADLQDENSGGESNTETFVRIAPELNAAQTARLREATDTLDSIGNRSKDASFQLYVSKLFEISAEMQNIGATNDDVECNSNTTIQEPDGVPDGFDGSAVDDEPRFQNNIDTADSDRKDSGLGADFALSSRLKEMSDDLAAAGSVEAFLDDEFNNDGDCIAP